MRDCLSDRDPVNMIDEFMIEALDPVEADDAPEKLPLATRQPELPAASATSFWCPIGEFRFDRTIRSDIGRPTSDVG